MSPARSLYTILFFALLLVTVVALLVWILQRNNLLWFGSQTQLPKSRPES
jgi:hypothetical protein